MYPLDELVGYAIGIGLVCAVASFALTLGGLGWVLDRIGGRR